MRRFAPALIVVGFVAPALATLGIRELWVRDVGAFIGQLRGDEWSNRDELARRYHRAELPCAEFHDYSREEIGRLIDAFRADLAASEWAGREGELKPLFRTWTDADEVAAHPHAVEDELDHLERRAGTADRLRFWLNRQRIEGYLRRPAVSLPASHGEPPKKMTPDERGRLRLFWRKHRLAPMAIRLSKLAI